MDSSEPLAGWLAYLGKQDCICPWQWKGLGLLYGQSFGNGWVRMTTEPDCPEHTE